MKRILNQPEHYVTDMLEGLYLAHPDQIERVNDDPHCLIRTNPISNKVGLITGGGSGHLPLFLGYVGDGLLDGCAIGDVFQSPNPEQIFALTKAVDQGAGVLYLYGNYNGDIFNFDLAADMADMEAGIATETVVVADDAAGKTDSARRGLAGMFFVYKCAGAAAGQMKDLQQVKEIAARAAANTRTMGVALTPCIIPAIGKAGFSIADDTMEIGMGIHGEPGIESSRMLTAEELTRTILAQIFEASAVQSGDRVAVLINGLGATPLEEQYIVYRSVHHMLAERGVAVARAWIGEFATSMEMAGLSISLMKLDDELESLLIVPANAVLYHQFG